jgi:uncharacterized protein (TIGR02246 family)
MNTEGILTVILNTLESAWNNASGADFGEPFANQSEYVDIRGTLHQHQSAVDIGNAHQNLFTGIYRDSKIVYRLVQAIQIDQNTILANAKSELYNPSGPMAGKNNSTLTMVLTLTNGQWKIRALQNTLVVKYLHS